MKLEIRRYKVDASNESALHADCDQPSCSHALANMNEESDISIHIFNIVPAGTVTLE